MRTTNSERTGLKIIICIQDDEPGFHAFCPALKEVHTYGMTEEEAIESCKDAIIAYLKSLVKHGDPIPATLFQSPQASTLQTRKSHCANGKSVVQSLELVTA